MKYIIIFLFLLSLIFSYAQLKTENPSQSGHPATDANPDWRLAVQFWSFHKYTFVESIDKAAELGVSWIEGYPGQPFGEEYPEVKFGHEMPVEYRLIVKELLKEKGLRIVNYGVVHLGNDEKINRTVFEFAKDMGIETIATEPPDEAWDLIEKLAKEYEINVGIHNHPAPSHYWNPDKVVEILKGRNEYIGACADIGHWVRSKVNPIEALQKLEGRIKSLHFKDLNEFGVKKAHDVPWGTGISDLPGVLQELKRQNFKGVFSIEYEYNWLASIPEIRQCVQYFNKRSGEINGLQWENLLAEDLSNTVQTADSWEFEDGLLTANGGGDIWTQARYGDFVLDLEFKLDEGTNSGVFLRTGSIAEWLHTAIEVQILDSYSKVKPDKHDCGAIFDCLEPSAMAVKKPGEWNRYTITCKAGIINVILNGQDVLDMDLNNWPEAHKNPDGSENKFNTAYKNMPREGHIGLQYHGNPVWFRNLKIKKF